MNDYVRALETDRQETTGYYRRSLDKSEQQKVLETLLDDRLDTAPSVILDAACGSGTLSHHLRQKYPLSRFALFDYSRLALQQVVADGGEHFGTSRFEADICRIPIRSDSCDLVCSLQTLSWIEDPEHALLELVRVAKRGGLVIASGLFNLDHDVDVFARVVDRTRKSGQSGMSYSYNTFSRELVETWTRHLSVSVEFVRFEMPFDLPRLGRGIGTYTYNTSEGRLQCSGGLLLQWAFLMVKKH